MEKRLIKYQNELLLKHYDEVENIYRQIRGWRHDYHHHIQVIKACLALGQIEELDRYCDRLDQDLKTVDNVIKTGNVMLDAILNSKLSLAIHKDINITCKANVSKELEISDVDLCILLGNLLDNAMEACTAVDINNGGQEKLEFDHPFIRVYIGMKGKHLYICVTNAVYGRVNRVGGRFISTKKSASHGFGLARMEKICKKYDGYCKQNSEQGVFTTEILLPVATG